MIKTKAASIRTDASLRAAAMASLLLAATLSLAACNTTAGAGQDVSATGHAVTNAADKVKSGL